jgi:endonuclease/exonuclease/phosphatase (EEP) superfamily protein YafD
VITVATLFVSGTASVLLAADSLVKWLIAILLVLSATPYLGRLHKYFELTSHFRVQYFLAAVGCLPLCLFASDLWCATGALLCVGINLWAIAPWYRARSTVNPGIGGQHIKLALVNVNQLNRAYERFVLCMEGHRPEVIVVQELDEDWARGLSEFARDYPFSEVLPMEDGSGMAVYSHLPFETLPLDLSEGSDRPGILVRLHTGKIMVSLLTIHPRAPIRRGHFELRNKMLASAAVCLNNLPEPKICVGDLNASLWSPFYEDFAAQTRLSNVRQGFGLLPSWPTFLQFRWLMIPIDHCLVSSGIRVAKVATGGQMGSDHLPLVVELDIFTRQPETE